MKKIILLLALSFILVSAVLVFAENNNSCNSDSDCTVFFSNCVCKNVCRNSQNIADCQRMCPVNESDHTSINCSCINNECAAKNKTNIGIGSQKNMTFWECVSDAAKVKNDCYKSSKDAAKTCFDNSKANKDKAAGKVCEASAKDSVKNCKTAFKAVKNECNKIKHNWWDAFRASFK